MLRTRPPDFISTEFSAGYSISTLIATRCLLDSPAGLRCRQIYFPDLPHASQYPSTPRGPQFLVFKKSVLNSSVSGVRTDTSYWKAIGKCGGRSPPPFSIGFPEGGGRSDPKADDFRTDFLNIRNFGPLGTWADLEGPNIYHLYLYLFAVGPKNKKCPRM